MIIILYNFALGTELTDLANLLGTLRYQVIFIGQAQLLSMPSRQNQPLLSQFGWAGKLARHRSVPSSPSSVNLVPSNARGSVRRPPCKRPLIKVSLEILVQCTLSSMKKKKGAHLHNLHELGG